MPIRPDKRKYYDAHWRKFRLTALAAAGHRCQRCGRPHRLLNVAHLSHDPADCRFLAVLCPSCHSKNDTPQRIAMTRRTRATQTRAALAGRRDPPGALSAAHLACAVAAA